MKSNRSQQGFLPPGQDPLRIITITTEKHHHAINVQLAVHRPPGYRRATRSLSVGRRRETRRCDLSLQKVSATTKQLGISLATPTPQKSKGVADVGLSRHISARRAWTKSASSSCRPAER